MGERFTSATLLVNGPADLREQMKQLPTAKMITTLARLRPDTDLGDPAAGYKAALRSLARRHAHLEDEIKQLLDPEVVAGEPGPSRRSFHGGLVACGADPVRGTGRAVASESTHELPGRGLDVGSVLGILIRTSD